MSGAARNLNRIFVGNLPWTISNSELRSFASKFGPVQSAVVVFNKSTGMSKGYGFVNFTTKDAVELATGGSSGSKFLEGNYLNIQPGLDNINE